MQKILITILLLTSSIIKCNSSLIERVLKSSQKEIDLASATDAAKDCNTSEFKHAIEKVSGSRNIYFIATQITKCSNSKECQEMAQFLLERPELSENTDENRFFIEHVCNEKNIGAMRAIVNRKFPNQYYCDELFDIAIRTGFTEGVKLMLEKGLKPRRHYPAEISQLWGNSESKKLERI